MKPHESDEGIYISGQISVTDIPGLAKAGIRTIICNRPDGEAEQQPEFTLVQHAANRHDMHVHYIPVTLAGITERNLQDMVAVLSRAEHPLLAYCRSGNRSNILYSLAKQYMNAG